MQGARLQFLWGRARTHRIALWVASLLSLGVAAAWAHSYVRADPSRNDEPDVPVFGLGDTGFGFTSRRGCIEFWEYWPWEPAHAVDFWIPYFLILPIPFVIPALCALRDERRMLSGLCASCYYDRRGLAPDANCPECGTVPTPAPT
jgi:hypothetical protein